MSAPASFALPPSVYTMRQAERLLSQMPEIRKPNVRNIYLHNYNQACELKTLNYEEMKKLVNSINISANNAVNDEEIEIAHKSARKVYLQLQKVFKKTDIWI